MDRPWTVLGSMICFECKDSVIISIINVICELYLANHSVWRSLGDAGNPNKHKIAAMKLLLQFKQHSEIVADWNERRCFGVLKCNEPTLKVAIYEMSQVDSRVQNKEFMVGFRIMIKNILFLGHTQVKPRGSIVYIDVPEITENNAEQREKWKKFMAQIRNSIWAYGRKKCDERRKKARKKAKLLAESNNKNGKKGKNRNNGQYDDEEDEYEEGSTSEEEGSTSEEEQGLTTEDEEGEIVEPESEHKENQEVANEEVENEQDGDGQIEDDEHKQNEEAQNVNDALNLLIPNEGGPQFTLTNIMLNASTENEESAPSRKRGRDDNDNNNGVDIAMDDNGNDNDIDIEIDGSDNDRSVVVNSEPAKKRRKLMELEESGNDIEINESGMPALTPGSSASANPPQTGGRRGGGRGRRGGGRGQRGGGRGKRGGGRGNRGRGNRRRRKGGRDRKSNHNKPSSPSPTPTSEEDTGPTASPAPHILLKEYGTRKKNNEIEIIKDQYKIENLKYDKDRFEAKSIFKTPGFEEVDEDLQQLVEDLQERTEKIEMSQKKWKKKRKEKKRNSKRKKKNKDKVEADEDTKDESDGKESEIEEKDLETEFYVNCVCYILHIHTPSMHRP